MVLSEESDEFYANITSGSSGGTGKTTKKEISEDIKCQRAELSALTAEVKC